MYSTEAAKRMEKESLDFAYIDARHDYCGVTEDLEVNSQIIVWLAIFHMKKNFPGLLAPHKTRWHNGRARLHVFGGGEQAHGFRLERLPQRDEARGRRQGRRRGLLSAKGADGQRGVYGSDLGHLAGAEATLLGIIWPLRQLRLFGGRQQDYGKT